ncbi:Type IV pilus biogenesis and competence protein PilQ, partial [Durusdinium trenchii]
SRILAAIVEPLPKDIYLERLTVTYRAAPRAISRRDNVRAAPPSPTEEQAAVNGAKADLAELRKHYDEQELIVTLAGMVEDEANLHNYLARLELSDWFTATELNDIQRDEKDGMKVSRFRVELTVRLRADLKSTTDMSYQAEIKGTRIEAIRADLESTKEYTDQWRKRALGMPKFAELYGRVLAMGRETGTVFHSFDPETPVSMNYLDQMSVQLVCGGDFDSIFEFIRRLEGFPEAILINSIDMVAPRQDGEMTQCRDRAKVDTAELVTRLKADAKANPAKVAVLGLLLAVAIYFWVPLAGKLFTKREPANVQPQPLVLDIASAVSEQEPTMTHQSWRDITDGISEDPDMEPAPKIEWERDPFAVAIAPPEPESEMVDDSIPIEASDAQVQLLLKGTLVSATKKTALINNDSYQQGDTIELAEGFSVEIERVATRYIVLEANGNRFQLELNTPTTISFGAFGIGVAMLLANAMPQKPRIDAPVAVSKQLEAAQESKPAEQTEAPVREHIQPVATTATDPKVAVAMPVAHEEPAPQVAETVPPVAQQQGESMDSLGPLLDLIQQVPNLKQLVDGTGIPTAPPPAEAAPTAAGPSQAAPAAPSAPQVPQGPLQQKPVVRASEGDDKLSFNISGMDIRTALEWLSEQGGLNIVATQSVTGIVNSVALNNVDAETALDVILESTGFVMRRKGRFVYVGTPEDFANLEQSRDTIITKVYRPNYVTAAELQTLITPLLSDRGSISVTTAAETGIQSDSDNAGGDSLANGDAVVVRDYELVLAEVDQVIAELDRRPMQVAIEAMILSVKLNDNTEFGINWQFLRDQDNVRFGSGSPRVEPLNGAGTVDSATGGTIGEFLFDGGLSFAFLDSSIGHFIEALETIGDTNVIATPRLMCLNKQRAEILIGAELGYVSTTVTQTQATQQVEFLRVGTELRLRPYISSDGLIRMEVHPQLSTGAVRVEEGFTLPDRETTEVTTNIMTRDGCTVIIGGLVREDLSVNSSQIPFLGSVPYLGVLFRQRSEEIERSEIVILITPNIVSEPETCCEGEQAACEMHRRHAVYSDHMSPISKQYLGRKYFRLSQEALALGDIRRAKRYIDFSIRLDPASRAAIELQNDLDAGTFDGDHSSNPPVMKGSLLYDPATYPGTGHFIESSGIHSGEVIVEGETIQGSLDGPDDPASGREPLSCRETAKTSALLCAVLAIACCAGCKSNPFEKVAAPLTNIAPDRVEREGEAIAEFERRRDKAQFTAALARYREGDLEECRRSLDGIIERNPEHSDARLLLAELLLVEKQPQVALQHVESVLVREPNNAAAIHTAGLVHEALGNPTVALEQFQRANQLDPENEVYLLSYDSAVDNPLRPAGNAHIDMNQTAMYAPISFGNAGGNGFTERQESWSGLLVEAEAALKAGNDLASREAFDRAMRFSGDNPQVPISIAVLILRHNRPELAREYLEPAVARFPNEPRLHRTLGLVLYRLGHYEASQVSIRQALSLDNTDALSYVLLGSALSKMGDRAAYEACLYEARRLDPSLAELR